MIYCIIHQIYHILSHYEIIGLLQTLGTIFAVVISIKGINLTKKINDYNVNYNYHQMQISLLSKRIENGQLAIEGITKTTPEVLAFLRGIQNDRKELKQHEKAIIDQCVNFPN